MSVYLVADLHGYEIGTATFFGSFFDTIDVRLTKGLFGKKYPITLDEFQTGTLRYENLDKAEVELRDIKKRLGKLKPSKVVWNKHDLIKQPPWGDDISEDITSMANYYVTSNGKDLFEIIFKAIHKAKELKCDLKIENL